MTKQNKKIVITGLGLVSAQGLSIKDFRAKEAGEPLPVSIKKEWEAEDIGPQFHYKTPPFDIKEIFPELRAPYPLRYSQLAMIGCKDAMEDAGLMDFDYDATRTGIVIDTALGTIEAIERYLEKLETDGPRKVSPFLFSQTVSNVAVGYVARQFGLRGPSSLLFCESSVAYGYDILKSGEADIMICGGVDNIRDSVFGLYHHNDVLFQCLDVEEEHAPKYFTEALTSQQSKNKVAFGEDSAAYLVLETLDHALSRGAVIYAELVDYAAVQDDAFENFISERNVNDCALSMEKVMQRCHKNPTDIQLVVGESSSPGMFDRVEGPAMRMLWEDQAVHYTSMKPFIGETLNASAQASVAMAAEALYTQRIKANPWLPYCSTHPAQPLSDTVDCQTALVHTTQLGGNNTSFILQSYKQQ
ncbi:MAG: beta-ketoacyl synthase N-terminal-like domain-containing protein [Saprospiraceae bacterium]